MQARLSRLCLAISVEVCVLVGPWDLLRADLVEGVQVAWSRDEVDP